MSTRCQVQIMDLCNIEPVATFYHHSDGYPKHMIPCLYKALHPEDMGSFQEKDFDAKGLFLESPCKSYRLLNDNRLHGDIDFLYKIYVWNSESSDDLVIKLDILHIPYSLWNEYKWICRTDYLTTIANSITLDEAMRKCRQGDFDYLQ